MAEELQGLLEKIHEEGIQKAGEEKERILAEAREEAEALLTKAKEKADSIVKKAREEADKSEKRAEATIRQAARDVVLALKGELQERLQELVRSAIGEAMTAEFMGKILLEMVKNHIVHGGEDDTGIEILVNKNDLEKMQQLFTGSLVEELKRVPEISLGHDFRSGLKIGFKGDDLFFDFTDDAISDIICAYIGPKLAAILDQSETAPKD